MGEISLEKQKSRYYLNDCQYGDWSQNSKMWAKDQLLFKGDFVVFGDTMVIITGDENQI